MRLRSILTWRRLKNRPGLRRVPADVRRPGRFGPLPERDSVARSRRYKTGIWSPPVDTSSHVFLSVTSRHSQRRGTAEYDARPLPSRSTRSTLIADLRDAHNIASVYTQLDRRSHIFSLYSGHQKCLHVSRDDLEYLDRYRPLGVRSRDSQSNAS